MVKFCLKNNNNFSLGQNITHSLSKQSQKFPSALIIHKEKKNYSSRSSHKEKGVCSFLCFCLMLGMNGIVKSVVEVKDGQVTIVIIMRAG